MSELINKNDNRAAIRRKLLTGASVLALAACVCAGDAAQADDGDQPQIWIELGGQLSGLNDGQETFSAPLMAGRPSNISPSGRFEKLPLYSIDETADIAFEPSGSDWVFSGSVRYGRSSSNRDVRQGTNPKPFVEYGVSGDRVVFYPVASQFAETTVHNSAQHLIADFQAGKDIGLGIFGKHGSSMLNLGVRFAQFSSKSNIALQSDPDWHFTTKYLPNGLAILHQAFNTNRANLLAERSFHGIGPSLSWNASAPFAGNSQNGELSFDGGLNAAILFGRQRAEIHHQSTGRYRPLELGAEAGPFYVTHPPTPVNKTRARTVTVPDVGGFAGLTFRLQNFKVSAGYRADMFFHAMDGGIDTRKSENIGFYGPFATISVGIGG
jgi:iron complex outermembrane receptor protein